MSAVSNDEVVKMIQHCERIADEYIYIDELLEDAEYVPDNGEGENDDESEEDDASEGVSENDENE